MEDKKTNTLTKDNANASGNKQPESLNLSEGKSKEQIKKEAIDQTSEFGSAGMDDINKNMGSFTKTVVKPAEANANEVKLDVDTKVVEKASKEKINFERFSKTRKAEKAAKTKFGEKVSIMLRSKKGLRTTWIIELVIMALITALSIALVVQCTRWWGYTTDDPAKPALMTMLQSTIKPGIVFCYIAMFPCLVPLIYLLTTWFIGINQVHSSRLFHFMFWGFELFALICLLIGLGLLIPCIHTWMTVPAYW